MKQVTFNEKISYYFYNKEEPDKSSISIRLDEIRFRDRIRKSEKILSQVLKKKLEDMISKSSSNTKL